MIRFPCPACGIRYKVADEFAGRRTKCRKCGEPLDVPGPPTPPPVRRRPITREPVQEVVESVPEVLPASLVTFAEHGEIRVQARNSAEAKLAIKELRAKKKQLSLSKRAITQQQREIRAAYTNLVRQRGSKFIGGGSIGRIIRGFQTFSRDAARSQLAAELAPLERRRYVFPSRH